MKNIVLFIIIIAFAKCEFDYLMITPSNDLQSQHQQQITTNIVQYELIKVRLGSSIKLECNYNIHGFVNSKEVSNDDTSVYKMLWLKENKGVIAINNEVKYNKDKYSIESTSTNSLNLVINNVQVEDNGKYVCQHFDFPNLKQFLIVILVPPQPPQISYKINNQSALQLTDNENLINLYENDFIQLTCFTKFVGNPSIAYKWFKNQIEIINQTHVTVLNNALYIRNIDPTNHMDRYTCGIYNEALDEPLKVNNLLNVYFKPLVIIHFNSSKSTMETKISDYLISYKTVENATEILLCSVKANPSPVKIEWYKDHKLLENITDYSYEISRINLNHQGLYSCRVYNSIGFGQYEVELNVQYKPLLYIESVNDVREGQNANIICEIDSNPTYSYVTWFFNKQQLTTPFSDASAELSSIKYASTINPLLKATDFSLTDFSFVQNTNRSVLRINSVRNSYNDAIIQCVASNEILVPVLGYTQRFSSEASTNLNVLYKPIIKGSAIKVAAGLNGTIEFNCTARSNPFSNFYWVFNDEIIDSTLESFDNSLVKITNDVLSYEERTQISKLKINYIEHKQLGWYKCYVNNSVGYTVHEIYLIQATIPDIPINLIALNKTYSSVLLKWRPEFDGGSVQKFIISINNKEEIETNTDSFLISHLQDSNQYVFKIKSFNKYGESGWSFPINVTTNSYPYSVKDIRLQISGIEREEDSLKVMLMETNNNKKSYYNPIKLDSFLMKLSIKSSIIEYFNVSKDQTYFSIPYSLFINKTDQINASICLNFDKSICSQPITIDFGRFNKEPLLNDNKNKNFLPADLINVVAKRFNILVVIAGSVLIALLIMVFGGYLIYRVAFGKNDDDNNNSENGSHKKKKNGLDIINTSPIIAYSEQEGVNDFQFSNDSLDAYSLNSSSNMNNTFNAAKIIPIPEMNEESVKDEELENNKRNSSSDSNVNSSATLTTNLTTDNLQDNPIYNHLTNGKGDALKIKNKRNNNNRNLF